MTLITIGGTVTLGLINLDNHQLRTSGSLSGSQGSSSKHCNFDGQFLNAFWQEGSGHKAQRFVLDRRDFRAVTGKEAALNRWDSTYDGFDNRYLFIGNTNINAYDDWNLNGANLIWNRAHGLSTPRGLCVMGDYLLVIN